MRLFRVCYEANDTWFFVGVVEGEDGGAAIEHMKETKLKEICSLTGYSSKEVMEEMNFDYEEICI